MSVYSFFMYAGSHFFDFHVQLLNNKHTVCCTTTLTAEVPSDKTWSFGRLHNLSFSKNRQRHRINSTDAKLTSRKLMLPREYKQSKIDKCHESRDRRSIRNGAKRLQASIHSNNRTMLERATCTVFQKNRTPKTDWHNFVKVCPLRMIFYRMHRHLIAD